MRKHLIRNHPFTSLSQPDEGDPDNITANECASVANNNPPEVNLTDQAIPSTNKSVTPNLTSSKLDLQLLQVLAKLSSQVRQLFIANLS